MAWYRFARPGWTPEQKNPFERDGKTTDWAAFLYHNQGFGYSHTYPGAKIHTLVVRPEGDPEFIRLRDYVQYENSFCRTVILSAPEGLLESAGEALEGRWDCRERLVRRSDPKYVVHSTTHAAWHSIRTMGVLLSAVQQRRQGLEVKEVGFLPMLEPPEYSRYVMLDIPEGCGEMTVCSRQTGRICRNPQEPYRPEVRLYFNAHRMIRNGLAVRDGLHPIKVKRELELGPYFLMALTAQDVDPNRQDWTPASFARAVDLEFRRRMGEN